MPASVASPADVVNLSLERIGYKNRIGHLYDGSPAAKKALDIYAQTRDAIMRQSDWDFAQRIVAATLSTGAAPAPWAVEYNYPTDCLRLRNLFNATYLADKNNPVSILWTVANSATKGHVIWTNAAAATLVYTAQVTNVTLWEPLFVEVLALELGKRLAAGLVGVEGVKMSMEDEKTIVPLAESTTG